jgi:hypothetical protein
MGPFNNYTLAYISWVVLKLKIFSFTKGFFPPLPIPIIFFINDNMKQYLNLLEDVRTSHVRRKMDRGPHHVTSFGDMSKNMLVN